MNEFDVIHHFFTTRFNTLVPAGTLGIGDDAAVYTAQGQQLLSVDTLVAGRHFFEHENPYYIGWKSAAVNFSDIAAMGGVPRYIALALSLPRVDAPWLDAFSQGLFDICTQFGVSLIGGDTTQSPTLSISITVIGALATGQHAVLRSGAQQGDVLCVSGTVGSAAYALAHYATLTLQQAELKEALVKPMPQVVLGQQLQGLATSMIDVSDGLAQDVQHIAHASQKNIVIETAQLPFHPALLAHTTPEQRLHYALYGGDDYQLAFTLNPAHYEQLCAQQLPITRIGRVMPTGQVGVLLCDAQGRLTPPVRAGYQHF